MKRVEEVGSAIAADAIRARVGEIADRCRAELSANVAIDGTDVVITGNHLLRQWLQNAELRTFARRR